MSNTPLEQDRDPAGARLRWVDTAKGIAAVAVVVGHAAMFSAAAGLPSPWSTLSDTFSTLPLPIFFFSAGLVAARATSTSSSRLLERVASLAWVYLLWSTISAFGFGRTGSSPVLHLLGLPVQPDQNIWFVFALALFLLVARCTRGIPVWVLLVLAVMLGCAFGSGGPLNDQQNPAWGKTALGLLPFLCGLHASRVRFRSASSTIRGGALLAASVYLGVASGAMRLGLTHLLGMNVALTMLAVVAGVAVAVAVTSTRIGTLLQFLGRRSLPIYLLQFFPTLLLPRLLVPIMDGAFSAALFPPILGVFSLVFAVLLHRLTERVSGLYAIPWSRSVPSRGRRSARLVQLSETFSRRGSTDGDRSAVGTAAETQSSPTRVGQRNATDRSAFSKTVNAPSTVASVIFLPSPSNARLARR